jgi:hypothetical protein
MQPIVQKMGWALASGKVKEMFLLLVFTRLEFVEAMLVAAGRGSSRN